MKPDLAIADLLPVLRVMLFVFAFPLALAAIGIVVERFKRNRRS